MKEVVVINRIMVKPGKMDEFIEAQRKFAAVLAPCGLIGGRMYRSFDGLSATLVSVFQSKEAVDDVFQRPDFKAHLQRLQPLVESSSPIRYEEAYTTGELDVKEPRAGRLHRALAALEKAHGDISKEEDNAYANGLRNRAVHDIEEAIHFTEAGIHA